MPRDPDLDWSVLMAAAQSGDGKSYARLLAEVVPMLRQAVRQRWPSAQRADIEDVVQETLKSLHAVRHTYDPSRPFAPWVLAILRHRALDTMRKRARSAGREVALEGHDETLSVDVANNGGELAPDREALRRAVANLPRGQRTAIELLKLKEMSLQEAAAETGMSVTALKVATHRAINALRVSLGGKL